VKQICFAKCFIDEESQKILDWLSPLNFWEKQHDALSRREAGTGQWILEEPAFIEWLDRTQRILWCPGMRMYTQTGPCISANTFVNSWSR